MKRPLDSHIPIVGWVDFSRPTMSRWWASKTRPTLLAMMLAAAGCAPAPADPMLPAGQNADTGVTVTVVTPQRTVIHREVSQPGAIEAFEETPVFARVAGYVKEGWKDIGATLRKGEILAELWVPEREVELRHKEALLRQAQSEIEQAQRAMVAAKAAFHSAEAKVAESVAKRLAAQARYNRAKSQHDRLRSMQQVIQKENIEEAQLGFETAQAGLAEAEAAVKFALAFQAENKAHWSKAEVDLIVAKDRLGVVQQQRDYARTMLDYARLPAPYDCVVTQRHINTGEFVSGEGAGNSKPLYVVHRTEQMRIFLQVPESDVPWVQKAVEASIRIQVLRGRTFRGTVARTSWSVDPATRTLRAEIDLPNADGVLRPGLYAYVTLRTDVSGLMTLPRSAVATEGDVTRGYQSFCYQVEDGKARRLLVELGAGDNARVEILKKQPRPGGPWEPLTGMEQIVQGNLSELHDGQAVTIRPRRP
jgi:HlyD family secretion protein